MTSRLLESTIGDGRKVILTNLTDEGVFVTAVETEDALGATLKDARVYPLGSLGEAILDWQRRKMEASC